MKLFIIPTWLPHRCHPLEGTFLIEQAEMIADLHPEWDIGMSRWGQGVGRLSWSHLRESPACFRDALFTRETSEHVRAGRLVEFGTRALSWSERIAHGNAYGILAANRANLQRAIGHFGGVDLLHAHVSYPGGWVSRELSRETGIPYVITEHMGPFPLPVYRGRPDWLERFVLSPLRDAHARIAVSPALADSMVQHGLPEPDVVPNFVDERRYPLAAPDPARPFTFFTLGGMQPVKGFPDLLRGIAYFLSALDGNERSRVRFELAGYGPELSAYQALASELKIADWVSWPGFLPREVARERFQHCDCYVLSSLYESFGIVLVEAMATGTPVIATRCGGPEALVEPWNGILVERQAPAQLGEAMLRMFRQRADWDRARIRDHILARFSRPAVMRALEQIYARVLSAAPPATRG